MMRWLISCYARPLWWRLGFGGAAAASAAALSEGILGTSEYRLVYLIFLPAVEAAALLCGFASGVAAALVSALLAYACMTPLTDRSDAVGLALFLSSSIVLSGLTEALHRARMGMLAAESLRGAGRHQTLNEHLQFAISPGAIGAWDLDLSANAAEASLETRMMPGFSPNERLNRKALFSTLAANTPAVRAGFEKAPDPAGNGQYCVTYRVRRAVEREERWFSTTAEAIFAKEKAARLTGICRDLTNEMTIEGLFIEKARLAEQLGSVAASVPGAIAHFVKAQMAENHSLTLRQISPRYMV